MTKENQIVPVILTDNSKHPTTTVAQKPKLACQMRIGDTELRVYNGANQYILTTILKELSHAD